MAYVWEYVEYTYPNSAELFNVRDQILEEVLTTEE